MTSLRLTVLRLTTGAALTLAATGAWGDGPSFNRESDLAAPTWTGFYLGGAVGYGLGFTSLSAVQVPEAGTSDIGLRGVQGVVSLGYDWRLGPRWVVGAFADYAFSEIEADAGTISVTIDNQWAVGGRLGYLLSPTTLLYGNAGYTQADFLLRDSFSPDFNIAEALRGVFVGGGIEHAVSRTISLKLEYRFSSYDPFDVNTGEALALDNEVHSVRVGVNWRFGRE
jgi:outer membrane immunogenic protein